MRANPYGGDTESTPVHDTKPVDKPIPAGPPRLMPRPGEPKPVGDGGPWTPPPPA